MRISITIRTVGFVSLLGTLSFHALADNTMLETAVMFNLTGLTVSSEDLAESKAKQGGGTLLQVNDNTQTSLLERNQLQSNLTGNNIIHSQALQGVEGIATIIQNTGNQVIIQGSTLLNLSITP